MAWNTLNGMVQAHSEVTVALLASAADHFGRTMRKRDVRNPTTSNEAPTAITIEFEYFRNFMMSRCPPEYFELAVTFLVTPAPETAASLMVRHGNKIRLGMLVGWLSEMLVCNPDLVERTIAGLHALNPGDISADLATRVDNEARAKLLFSPSGRSCPLRTYSPADLAPVPAPIVETSTESPINTLAYVYWLMEDSYLIERDFFDRSYLLAELCSEVEPELEQLLTESASTTEDFATRNAARILGSACTPKSHAWLARAVRKGWTRPKPAAPRKRNAPPIPPRRDSIAWMGHVALRDGLAFGNSPFLKEVLLDTPDPRDADVIAAVNWETGLERERIREKLLAWQMTYPEDAGVRAAILSITPRLP
ncbi:MAG: hypothetical protein IV100_08800 [Myxococcales bacterium]|nr:hypothetical protein [Myxococcales bacterium]